MSATRNSAVVPRPLELVVTRLIDAPQALVFKAWTQQEHAARWWGPQGFTVVSCVLDATEGRSYRVAMQAADGTVRTKRGVYRAVIPPERLVFTYAWEDANGNPGHEMHVTVTFEAKGAQTLLTLRQTGFEDVPERDGHRGGWTSCLERFAGYMMAMATQ